MMLTVIYRRAKDYENEIRIIDEALKVLIPKHPTLLDKYTKKEQSYRATLKKKRLKIIDTKVMREIDTNSTLQERLNRVFDYLKDKGVIHNQNHLAEQIGYKRAFVSQALSGKAKISYLLMLAVYSRYDEFSLEWLMTGNGEMLEQPKKTPVLMEELKKLSKEVEKIKEKIGL